MIDSKSQAGSVIFLCPYWIIFGNMKKDELTPGRYHHALPTVILLLGVSVIGSNSFLMSPIINNISISLGSTVAQVAWVISAYGGSAALAGLFLSGMAQRIGYRPTLFLSGVMLSTGILATGLAADWAMLIVAQILAGVAAGIMLPTLYSMTAFIAPKGKESATLGKVISGWSLAMIAGVPLGAFISDVLSWRHAYYIVFAFSLISTLGYFRLPSGGTPTTITTFNAAFRVPKAKPVFLISFLYMVSFYGVYIFLGSYIQRELDYSAAYAGSAVLAYGLGFGVAGMLLGKILDIWSPWKIIGPVLLCISGVYLGLIGFSKSYWSLLPGCVLWGVANQIGLNCLVSILTQLDDRQRVRLMGIYNAVAYGGTMVAGLVFGVLYQNTGFDMLLILSASLCIIAFMISVRVISRFRSDPDQA